MFTAWPDQPASHEHDCWTVTAVREPLVVGAEQTP